MSPRLIDLDSKDLPAELHERTLKGQLQTWVARGGSEGSLRKLVKTAATYRWKGYVSRDTLRRLLAEVESETVEDFRSWKDYEGRKQRFETLTAVLSDMFKHEDLLP